MENKKNYHGYLLLPRQIVLLQDRLGNSLYAIYHRLVLEARFDRRNPKFGYVIGTQAEIAERLKMSQSTLSRTFKELNEKFRYCVIKRKDEVNLGFFPLFSKEVAQKIYNNDYANLEEMYADMYEINAEVQANYALLQKDRDQKYHQRLYRSSSVDLSSSPLNTIDHQDKVDRNL